MPVSDVVIVGASAVGGITAKESAKLGLSVTMLEEHSIPGKMHKCSGIMSKKGMDSLGVNYYPTVLNEIFGARIFNGEKYFDVRRNSTVAVVIDRQAFDEQCVDEALDYGAELKKNFRVSSFKEGPEYIRASNGVEDVQGKVLIGCDGVTSITAKLNGFPEIPLSETVVAFEGEYDNVDVRKSDEVDVFLDQKAFPGFFGWVIPVSETRARIGFATKNHKDISRLKDEFVEKFVSKKCVSCREFHHLIPLAVREQTQKGRILLAGDAAGQVKSTTGGGVVFGGNCGKIAASSVKQFLQTGELNYEQAWRNKYYSSLKSHRKLHDFYNSVPSSVFSSLFGLFSKAGLPVLLNKFGDMDFIVSKN
ncbi:NAD(P)/FAD-dependent oxidoreductase [Candidatus Micrarchaeota archaeon]|nr:NAD(P)/FAD-dependent oxidoreductase [Candidatus Micrarchaeota archaeon]